MIFGSGRKKQWKKVIPQKNQGLQQGRSKVEIGFLWLCNDKNNVIPNKVLSYF